MFQKARQVFIAAIYLVAGQANLSLAQQSSAPRDDRWTTASADQTVYGIRYAEDGKVWNGKNLVTTCRQTSERFTSPHRLPSEGWWP